MEQELQRTILSFCASREHVYSTEISTDWPYDCCRDSCLIIIDELRATFTNTKFAVKEGWLWCNKEEECSGHAHSWIQTKEGWIVDPTFAQFNIPPHMRKRITRKSQLGFDEGFGHEAGCSCELKHQNAVAIISPDLAASLYTVRKRLSQKRPEVRFLSDMQARETEPVSLGL
jgi:hypothetical protein